MQIKFANKFVFPHGKDIEQGCLAVHGRPLREIFPLAQEEFTLELRDVDISIANAISRIITGESTGLCLDFSMADFSTTDSHMRPEIVALQVRQIPLLASLRDKEYESLVLSLDVNNPSAENRWVYSGDLVSKAQGPLFNKTTIIADLQPGSTMQINNIKVRTGQIGADYIFSQVAKCITLPIDIPEHDPTEVRNTEKGIGRRSGYSVRATVFEPRNHTVVGEVNAVLPTEPMAKKLIKAACNTAVQRLRRLQQILMQKPAGRLDSLQSSSTWYTTSEEGLSVLYVIAQNETATVGELIKGGVLAENPSTVVTYTPNDDIGVLRIRLALNADLPALLHTAIRSVIQHFDAIDLEAL